MRARRVALKVAAWHQHGSSKRPLRAGAQALAPPQSGQSRRGLGSAAIRRQSLRLRAVTSISIFMPGSARPAEIIIAAGRTGPKYLRITGQQAANSEASG